jgi:hypothetical protein
VRELWIPTSWLALHTLQQQLHRCCAALRVLERMEQADRVGVDAEDERRRGHDVALMELAEVARHRLPCKPVAALAKPQLRQHRVRHVAKRHAVEGVSEVAIVVEPAQPWVPHATMQVLTTDAWCR